jgi:hypothetical protein
VCPCLRINLDIVEKKKKVGTLVPRINVEINTLPIDAVTFIRTENPATHGDYKCTGFRYLCNKFLFAGTLICKEPKIFLHFPWIPLDYNTYCFM